MLLRSCIHQCQGLSHTCNIITLALLHSAKSEDALINKARLLISTLEVAVTDSSELSNIDMYTLSANLARRQTHFSVRVAFPAASMAELLQALKTFVEQADSDQLKEGEVARVPATPKDSPPPKLAMIFSGQGSQWVGMGKELYETEPVFQRTVDAIDEYWIKQCGELMARAAPCISY